MTDPKHKFKRSTIQPRGIKVCILNFIYEIYFTFPNFILSVAVNANVQIKLLYCRVWQVRHKPTELRLIDMFRKIHFPCPDPVSQGYRTLQYESIMKTYIFKYTENFTSEK